MLKIILWKPHAVRLVGKAHFHLQKSLSEISGGLRPYALHCLRGPNGVDSFLKPSRSILSFSCVLRPGEWPTPLKSCFLARLCSRESPSINWRSMGRERRRKEQKEEKGGGEKKTETGYTRSLSLLYLSSWGCSTCLCYWKEELPAGKTETGRLSLVGCSLPKVVIPSYQTTLLYLVTICHFLHLEDMSPIVISLICEAHRNWWRQFPSLLRNGK